MNYIQSNIWNLLKFLHIDKVENIYQLNGYTNYTNYKFLEVEEKDALFL